MFPMEIFKKTSKGFEMEKEVGRVAVFLVTAAKDGASHADYGAALLNSYLVIV
jgi:hypothetical protein